MNSPVQHMLEEDLIKLLCITCFGKVLMAVIFALLESIFKREFNSIGSSCCALVVLFLLT